MKFILCVHTLEIHHQLAVGVFDVVVVVISVVVVVKKNALATWNTSITNDPNSVSSNMGGHPEEIVTHDPLTEEYILNIPRTSAHCKVK